MKLIAGKRLGLFGGSFNPPHVGHLEIAKLAIKKLKLDKLFWLVVPQSPFKKDKDYLDTQKRLTLCKNLIGRFKKMEAIDFETGLRTFETVETIKKAKRVFPHSELFWLMGDDGIFLFHLWKLPWLIAKNTKIVIFNRGKLHRAKRTQSYFKYRPLTFWNRYNKASSTKIRDTLGSNWKQKI